MSKHKLSISELKDKLQTLQNQLDHEEQKLNSEIGAWVRQQTNVDSLKDLQNNFIIIPQKNKPQSEKVFEKFSTSSPSTFPTGQKNQSASQADFKNSATNSTPQTKLEDDFLFEST